MTLVMLLMAAMTYMPLRNFLAGEEIHQPWKMAVCLGAAVLVVLAGIVSGSEERQ